MNHFSERFVGQVSLTQVGECSCCVYSGEEAGNGIALGLRDTPEHGHPGGSFTEVGKMPGGFDARAQAGVPGGGDVLEYRQCEVSFTEAGKVPGGFGAGSGTDVPGAGNALERGYRTG